MSVSLDRHARRVPRVALHAVLLAAAASAPLHAQIAAAQPATTQSDAAPAVIAAAAADGAPVDTPVDATEIARSDAAPDASADAGPDAGPDANASADAADGLTTVTVTARRVAENAQKVPIPIATLSGDALEADGTVRLEALNQKLPSTNIQYANPRQNSFSLRGLGNNPANDALESDVGVYLDNVYLGRPGMAQFDLIDIDQVFLLRGPQGTLFGKNTTAGVLNLSTRQPTFTPEGLAEYSIGNLGYQQARASISGPLVDNTLAGRLTVSRTAQDGYLNDIFDGRDLNGTQRESARGQLLYQQGSFDLRVIADYEHEDEACCAGVLYYAGANNGAAYYSHVEAAGGTAVYDPQLRTSTINDQQRVYVRQGGASAEANWTVDDYKLTSVTAWRNWFFRPTNDGDGTSAPAITRAGQQVDDQQFSEELRVASPTDRAIEYVGGLYYFYQTQSNDAFTQYGPAADAFLGRAQGTFNNVYSHTHADLRTQSVSLFAQATWHTTDRLDLTGGLRETYEYKSTTIDRDAPVGGNATTAAALAPYESGKLDLDDDNLSGLVSLSYKISDDVLGYASVARGAKSGGINPAVPPTVNGVLDSSYLFIDPQSVWDGELGIKTTLLERRLSFNANLFWAQIKDYQATTSFPDPATGSYRSILSNAGSVRTRGVETDIEAVPVHGLTFTLAASYNDATYRDYQNGPCPAEVTEVNASQAFCDLSGKPVPGAPRWIVNPGLRLEQPLGASLQGYGIAGYSWRSSYYATQDDSEHAKVGGFGIANFRIGLRGPAGSLGWDVSTWVSNAFDKRYAQTGLGGQGNYGTYTLYPGQPRLWGATLRVNF